MTSYMNVSVESGSIAHEMASDVYFAYDILSELAYHLEGDYERFASKLFKSIFEEENTDILDLLNTIVKQFEHLKETESDFSPLVVKR